MPELPEVETTRRGLIPLAVGRRIDDMIVRDRRLRWPVADELPALARGRRIGALARRAKYLLFLLDSGERLMLHLGMSGSLRVVPAATAPPPHDHIDLRLDSGQFIRYNDPRRFGSLHHLPAAPAGHPLLDRLGPEPLSEAFSGDHLYSCSRGRRASVKGFLMDSRIVVGVGNIYANEALFRAGIHPARPAGRVSRRRYRALAAVVQGVLQEAIELGGTTLRNFTGTDGAPGYFRQSLYAYGRAGLPCRRCDTTLRERRLGQRTTVFCPRCQH